MRFGFPHPNVLKTGVGADRSPEGKDKIVEAVDGVARKREGRGETTCLCKGQISGVVWQNLGNMADLR